jgi:hypothetical protein
MKTIESITDPIQRKDYLLDLLRDNECQVTFTKVDGTVRSMPCTLKESRLPAKPVTESTKKKSNPDLISVFCTDKNEWRSFRVANVTNIEIL